MKEQIIEIIRYYSTSDDMHPELAGQSRNEAATAITKLLRDKLEEEVKKLEYRKGGAFLAFQNTKTQSFISGLDFSITQLRQTIKTLEHE